MTQQHPGAAGVVMDQHGVDEALHDLDSAAPAGREGITFTRSRAYRKNDSAHVEQKNGARVRALVGYDRSTSRAAYAQLARVYRLLRLHSNFFQPVQRLLAKHRQGARVHRVYDRAQTPFQRLVAQHALAPAAHAALQRQYDTLNPLQLRRQIDAALAQLWRLATRDSAPPTALERLRAAAAAQ